MKITESKLRRIIRSVIKESMDLVKNSRGNIDLNKRGKKISGQEARKLKSDFFDKKQYGKSYGRLAADADTAILYDLLRGGSYGNTNEVVLNPEDRKDINWAMENEPMALLPLFVIEDKGLKAEVNVIVFKSIGDNQHYMLRLDGESFVDLGAPGYHGDNPDKKYSNPEGELFANRSFKSQDDVDQAMKRFAERDRRRKDREQEEIDNFYKNIR